MAEYQSTSDAKNQTMYAVPPSQRGGVELNSLSDLVEKPRAPQNFSKEQQDYFDRLAAEAQSGHKQAAPLVKADKSTAEAVPPKGPTPQQRAALAQKAAASSVPTAEQREQLLAAAMQQSTLGRSRKDGPSAEDRARLAAEAQTRSGTMSSGGGSRHMPSAEERAALAAAAMQTSKTATISSSHSMPTAEQRAQLAAMAMAGKNHTAPRGAPSAEDRARLAAMAMGQRDDDDDEEEEGADADKSEEARARRRAKKKARISVPEAPERSRIPLPPVRGRDYELRIKALEDLAKQAALTTAALPSTCMYTLFNAQESCTCIGFSDDSTLMAGGFADSSIRLWDLTGKGLRAVRPSDQLETLDDRSWDAILDETITTSKTLHGHSGTIYAVCFSPDNLFLLSSSEDSTVRLWSLLTFSAVVCYRGHNYPVWDCAFSPLGHYFATASHDRTARVWTTEAIHPVRILAGHLADVDRVIFHPNGNYVATGSADRTCRLWDVQTGECVRLFQGHGGGVLALAISPDGRLLASSGEDATVILWDIAAGRRCRALHGHSAVVYNLSFCFGAPSAVLASGGLDNRVCIWDVGAATRADLSNLGTEDEDDDRERESSELLKTYHTKATSITALRFARVNVLLAAGVFAAD
eukprot:m.71614 g.71614  ORF g.71614 m.71614 type:complete len:639 (+) comp7642_c0_seq3:139-2055(+)